MCAVPKQGFNALAAIAAAALTGVLCAPARAGDSADGGSGGVSIGESAGGIIDRVYVTAPPHYLYVVEKARGSFLDCGEGSDGRAVDEDGRDLATLRCGVTLTETIVIPAAATSARIIVHY